MKIDLKELYFTIREYLEMRLPGLPSTPQGMNKKFNKEHWPRRRREGRGGGREYSLELLPAKAQMAYIEHTLNLSKTNTDETPAQKDVIRMKPWQREIADKRTTIVKEFCEVIKDVPKKKRTEFKRKYSKNHNINYRTLDGWIKAYQHGGYHALVPNWNNGEHAKIITPEMAKFIEKVYLQPLGPPIKKVHEDLCKTFADKCPRLPTYRTIAAFIT